MEFLQPQNGKPFWFSLIPSEFFWESINFFIPRSWAVSDITQGAEVVNLDRKTEIPYTLSIMVITYQGGAFVKVQFGDITIAVNPVSKDSKLKASRFGADIALVSVNHVDFCGVDQVSFGEKNAFAITGPGEYEIKDVFIKGFKSDSQYGGEPRLNTIYTVNLENMNMCFLGGHATKELPSDVAEALDDIDILFVPIGADGVLAPSDAYKLAVKLEPKLIVPLYFGNTAALKVFLKEAGEEAQKPQDKLTLKKKDLDGKEADVVVLEPQS